MTLFPKTIVVNTLTGSYVNGEWSSTPVPGTFLGSVQPMSGKEVEALGIARHDGGYVKVYSNTALNVSEEGGDQEGDRVTWQNQIWEVVKDLRFQNDIISHYKYVAQYISAVES